MSCADYWHQMESRPSNHPYVRAGTEGAAGLTVTVAVSTLSVEAERRVEMFDTPMNHRSLRVRIKKTDEEETEDDANLSLQYLPARKLSYASDPTTAKRRPSKKHKKE